MEEIVPVRELNVCFFLSFVSPLLLLTDYNQCKKKRIFIKINKPNSWILENIDDELETV